MMDDETIKKDIIDQLYWDGRIDASTVKVEVNGGRVKLEGSVPTYRARKAAYDNAFLIPYVVSVDNQLDVKYILDEFPLDEEIRNDIKGGFEWDPDFNQEKIDVSVENGFVELTGTVRKYWQKYIAEVHAENVLGVIGIKNLISVVPTEKRDDELIAEDIVRALDRNVWVEAESITVKVNNGKVTLSGTVSSHLEKSHAFDAAFYTAGVTDVDDTALTVIHS